MYVACGWCWRLLVVVGGCCLLVFAVGVSGCWLSVVVERSG